MYASSAGGREWILVDSSSCAGGQSFLWGKCRSGEVTSRFSGLDSEAIRSGQSQTCEQPAVPAGVEQAPGGEEAQQAVWDAAACCHHCTPHCIQVTCITTCCAYSTSHIVFAEFTLPHSMYLGAW